MKKLFLLFIAVIASPLLLHGQAAKNIVPSDNLILKNIPPIPASIATEVKKYTESRSASPVDWHPLKREMIIATRFGNTSQLHYVKMPGGARTQITFADEPVGNATFEPKRGDYFIFNRDAGGNEFSQLYRYDMKNGDITLISDGGRSQNGNIRWSKSKDRISFTSTRRNGADRDIYVMDPTDINSVRMVKQVEGGGWSVSDWSPDDQRMMVTQNISVNESNLFVLDITSGKMTPVGPVSKKEQVVNAWGTFSKDGNHIFFVTDHQSEFRRLARMNADGTDVRYLTTSIPWDVSSYDLKDDGTRILFTTNENGNSGVYVLDTQKLTFEALKQLPQGLVGSISWRPASEEFMFSFSSARNNSDIYSYSFETFQLERWTESELGGIVAETLVEPELIKWKSFDGKEISGFYYRPGAGFDGKRPVLIMIHGGPEGQSRPGFQGRNNYFLEQMGVAVIYPNVRGSTGYGKTFVKLDNGYLRENSVKDIGALLDWIATQAGLDASRVMVMGGSYGGYMTLAVSTNYPEKIRCAVDIVGISNFNTFLKNTEDYRRDLRRVEYGDERDPKMYAFLEKISPLNNAAKITKPLFIIQGGNDPRVPRTEAEQMFNTLHNAGKTVWYLEAKDEGHGFRKKTNADFQFYSTVEFMRRYLLD
jgi:dipeptidyl aminopeptidase/acylaminoacyl peptidase